MKIDGIDPLQSNKIKEPVQKSQVEDSQKAPHDPGLKERSRVLGKERQMLEDDVSYQGKLQQALEKTNSTAKVLNMHLRFRLHEESERYMVQVVDIEKNEVIKEIPPEKLLNLVAQIQNLIGLLLDTEC